MYKIILTFVSLITCNVALSDCGLSCGDSSSSAHTYMGTNVHIRHTNYVKGYGHNFLRHRLPQVNIYAGIKLNDSIGLEAGYDRSIMRERTSRLSSNDIIAGTPIPNSFHFALFKGKIKFEGPYIDIVGFHPLGESGNLHLLGFAGISFLKGKAERRIVCINEFSHCSVRTMKEDKLINRFSLGIQYMITSHLGARGMLGWQNTSKFKFYSSDDRCASYYPEIRPKDTITYGLGLLFDF
jgi:hypothetical protein